MKLKNYEVFVLILSAGLLCRPVSACSPQFPNALLDGGDAVLAPPVLDFTRELARMKISPSPFQARPNTNSPAEQSQEMDLADLRVALAKAGVAKAERERILEEQRIAREKLEAYYGEVKHWDRWHAYDEDDTQTKALRPELKEIQIPEGLPGEFADYFQGLTAFRKGDTNEAREHWETLLKRPKAERHYRTVWATYMLGRSFGDEDQERAIEYHTQVRALAKSGFSDTLGLAAASLGWEAQANLKLKKYERAIELYLQQYSTDHDTPVESLGIAAGEALGTEPDELETLARNPQTQRVITAFIIARKHFNAADPRALAWLNAVEAAGVKNVAAAEQLALAAYQNDQMETAERWIARAPDSPTSQWLRAKLLLRAGNVEEAAELLKQVSTKFPLEPKKDADDDLAHATFEDNLYLDSEFYSENRTAGSQVLGELGAVHLARREYVESLDCLLHAGFWCDAAYVAERVLTVEELKAYVDEHWQTVEPKAETEDSAQIRKFDVRNAIRHLLGRRLTRLNRGHEAREYYPVDLQAKLDSLMQFASAGWDESLPAADRATNLFAAAEITREDGMELIGTELAPDWFYHGGNFEIGVTMDTRTNCTILKPNRDEISRHDSNNPNPDQRFHYRYIAAGLAWEAAKLMPNNTDETASVLWTAGCWLASRDPIAADPFYKSLVRRCRKTALGEEADRIRWFPQLDDKGNIIPGKTRRKEPVEIPAPPVDSPTVDPANPETTPPPEVTN